MSLLDKASLIQIPSGYKNGKLYSVKPTPTYGSELITNGDFDTDSDWTINDWSISGGLLNGSASTGIVFQNPSGVIVGKTYKVILEVKSYTSGSIRIKFGGSSYSNVASQVGVQEFYIQAVTTGGFLISVISAFTGSIDNVSVKEVLNDGDFTFSRSSSATRVNSEGLIEVASVLGSEEVTNGDFATDSDWPKGSNTTISNGEASFNGVSSYVYQNILTIGKTYKCSVSVKDWVSGVAFSVGSSATGSGTIYSEITKQSDTITTFTFTAVSTILGIGSRSFNIEGSIDNVSVKEVIENDVPRLDYSGGASCASLLLEGQSTNLIRYSESFENSWWQKLNNVTVSGTKVTSPDGTLNASQLIFDGTSDGRIEKAITGLTSGADYSVSVYARVSSGTQVVSFGSVNVESFTLTTEWQRLTRTESENDTVGYPRFICDDAVTIEVWGFQLEQGSYPTSYIPSNSGSQTTRTADVCNNAGTSATFNDSEGVLFAEIAALEETSSSSKYISISDETYNNRLSILFSSGATNQIRAFLRVGGTPQVDFNGSVTDVTDYNKVAFKYKANDFALWINGVEVATDISGSVFSADTLTKLSFSEINTSGNKFEGKTKQLIYFDEALSDEELSDLTGQVNLSFNNLATFYGYTIL